jgi:hypothetical protein
MTRHIYFCSGLLLTLALASLAVPAPAQDQGTMTAPPWGDAGARITFGDEDQGVLQVQYKGNSGHRPDSDRGGRRTHEQLISGATGSSWGLSTRSASTSREP